MIIGIDVGNTAIKVAHLDGSRVVDSHRLPTRPGPDAQAVAAMLADANSTDGVVLVSVVPAWTAAIREGASRLAVPLLVARAATIPMANLLSEPDRVGTDRLMAAFAARELYGAPVIVIDLGTATTIDGVDARGAFAGGAILPGPELSGRALASGTAQLPAIGLEAPEQALGRDTVEAIAVGVVLGQVEAISGLLKRIAAELVPARQRARVVLTGGGSLAPWAAAIRGVDVVDPDLVLRGLGLLHAALTAQPAGQPAGQPA